MLDGKKILVAEDDETSLEAYKAYFGIKKETKLAKMFYAKNTRECLDILDNEKPDWLLLNLGLEDTNPLSGLKILHNYKDRVKIIVITGYDEFKQQCLEDGAVNFLRKPIVDPKQLIAFMLVHS